MSEDDKRDAEQDALNARLEKLDAALRQRAEEQQAKDAPPPERQGMSKALSVGLNAFSEFAGAVVVGGLIGWKADEWLGTRPWLMIVLLGLGVAAGFWNIYRLAKPKAESGGNV
jgi:ATP synthase protein I